LKKIKNEPNLLYELFKTTDIKSIQESLEYINQVHSS